MKFLLLFLLLGCNSLLAQNSYVLNGTVKDAANNETLQGVTVSVLSLHIGTVTNEYGFYSLKIPEGVHQVTISYLGYEKINEALSLSSNQTKDFLLSERTEDLDEVIIKQDKSQLKIKDPEMSVNELSIGTIQQMPVVFGEVDVVKSLLLLPGVSNAGEGSSGYNVRGGAVGENLILLDEATIYNASHLFGLFSVFNPDAIKNLKLYKGGIPAKYGGRVSSVLEIYQKDGNSKELEGNGGIGVISSRLLLQGPIVKDKASFLVGARSSYAHLFLKLTNNPNSAYFYDLNTKLSYDINKNNKILFSGYFGRDVFNINDSFKNTYGNAVFNLRWNHTLTKNIFTNLSVIYSDYYYGLTLNFVEFNWNSGIKNMNIKYDFDHYINEHIKLNYGIQNTYYGFNPGEIEPSTPTSGINYKKLTRKSAFENAVYLSVKQKFSNKISAEYGLRMSTFARFGQDSLYLYKNNKPVIFNEQYGIYQKAEPVGTDLLPSSKVEKSFINLEPRFSLSYSLNDHQSLKISYNRMSQYLHLITNTSSPTPLDVWAPSGKYIQPQILDQVALGYFQNFNQSKYSLEAEGFYKYIRHRIDYIDGANLIANNALEQVILPGNARAYGLEFLFKKNKGRLTGWLSYTLSKS